MSYRYRVTTIGHDLQEDLMPPDRWSGDWEAVNVSAMPRHFDGQAVIYVLWRSLIIHPDTDRPEMPPPSVKLDVEDY